MPARDWLSRLGGLRRRRREAERLLTSLFTMAFAVEARDPYTGGHLWRVSQYCRLVGTRLGLSSGEIARISLGGFLHDLGKIGVPDAVLQKRGRLTETENAVMKTHPEVGARLLNGHPLVALAAGAVQSHHERPDGQGYPRGLEGSGIPRDARVVAVCDAFDAMTSYRPYRQGMSVDKALTIIRDSRGSQFDPEATDALLSLDRERDLAPIVGHTDEAVPLRDCPICGPTLVVRRDHRPGDSVHCASCGEQFVLETAGDRLEPRSTGRKAALAERQIVPDMAMIRGLLDRIGPHLD